MREEFRRAKAIRKAEENAVQERKVQFYKIQLTIQFWMLYFHQFSV